MAFNNNRHSPARRTGSPRDRLGDVWLISELYYPELTSTGYFLTGIAEGLAPRHRVRVLCAQPTYAARAVTAPKRETRNAVEIERCWSTRFDKDWTFGRLANLLTVTASLGWYALLRIRRGDRVLVVTNPPPLPFVVSLAARIRGAIAILIVHDVYPDVLVATGTISERGVVRNAFDWINERLYRSFARIVVLGRDMHTLIASRLGQRAGGRVRIIPNWGDVISIRPLSRSANPVRLDLGIDPGALVAGYIGHMGRSHGIEVLLAAAEELREADIHFLFVGRGAKLQWLQSEITVRDLDRCHAMPGCTDDELSIYHAACDVCMISFLPGMAGVSVPSRLYNALASGRAIVAVADDHSELARVVREEGAGWVVPPGQPMALAETLRRVAEDRDEVQRRGDAGRRAAEARYTKEHALCAYDLMLGELIVH